MVACVRVWCSKSPRSTLKGKRLPWSILASSFKSRVSCTSSICIFQSQNFFLMSCVLRAGFAIGWVVDVNVRNSIFIVKVITYRAPWWVLVVLFVVISGREILVLGRYRHKIVLLSNAEFGCYGLVYPRKCRVKIVIDVVTFWNGCYYFLHIKKSENFLEMLKKRKVLATGLKVIIQNRTLLPFEIGLFFKFCRKEWIGQILEKDSQEVLKLSCYLLYLFID